MRLHRISTALFVLVFAASTVYAQTRDLNVHSIKLDNGAGGTLTINYTAVGNGTWDINTSSPASLTVGSSQGQTLYWNNGTGVWTATSLVNVNPSLGATGVLKINGTIDAVAGNDFSSNNWDLNVGGDAIVQGLFKVGTASMIFNGSTQTISTSSGALNLSPATTTVVTGGMTLSGFATGIIKSTAGVLSSGTVDMTSNVNGVLPIANGGTGLSTFSQGDMVYYTSGTSFSALAKNTSATRYISNTGASNAPAWAQIDLTNGVTGTLPVGSGGTGAVSFTTNGVLYGNNTAAVGSTAASTASGQFLQTTTAGVAPTWLTVLLAANGGTGFNGSGATNGQLPIGNGSGFQLGNVTATTDQTTVTNSAGGIQIGTVQDINTTSSPTFAGLTVNGNITVTGTVDGVDVSAADANNVKLTGAQTVAGSKTFTSKVLVDDAGGTNSEYGEGGVDKNSGATETWAVTNSGAGVTNLTADGSITAGTGMTVTTGNLGVSAGNITVSGTVDGVDVSAADAQNVKLTGGQTVAGQKTFTSKVVLNDAAGTDAQYGEGGVDISSASAETFAIQNSGAGVTNMTVDGAITAGTGLTVNANAANIKATTNQLVLGTTNTTTINSVAPAASRTHTLQDVASNGNVVVQTVGPAAIGSMLGTIQSGTGTLNGAGTVVIGGGGGSITVNGNSIIVVTARTPAGGGPGLLSVPTAGRTNGGPGTGAFTVNSTVGADASTFDWIIIN